ncbi:hypothetical protein BWR59_19675 [Pseudomonas sp. Bc-h]|nr:hypothetical protein BWR59_19675 [Pseudomonas sp. Bc-h]
MLGIAQWEPAITLKHFGARIVRPTIPLGEDNLRLNRFNSQEMAVVFDHDFSLRIEFRQVLDQLAYVHRGHPFRLIDGSVGRNPVRGLEPEGFYASPDP